MPKAFVFTYEKKHINRYVQIVNSQFTKIDHRIILSFSIYSQNVKRQRITCKIVSLVETLTCKINIKLTYAISPFSQSC